MATNPAQSTRFEQITRLFFKEASDRLNRPQDSFDPATFRTAHGTTPIGYIFLYKDINDVQGRLKRAGYSLCREDLLADAGHGRSLLTCALQGDEHRQGEMEKILAILVSQGESLSRADWTSSVDEYGWNPLMYALRYGGPNACQVIIEHLQAQGESLGRADWIEPVNKKGANPFMLALRYGGENAFEVIQDSLMPTDRLRCEDLMHPSVQSSITGEIWTPLRLATSFGGREEAYYLAAVSTSSNPPPVIASDSAHSMSPLQTSIPDQGVVV